MVTKLVVIVINIPYQVIGYWLGYLYSHQSVKICLRDFWAQILLWGLQHHNCHNTFQSHATAHAKVWKVPTKYDTQ